MNEKERGLWIEINGIKKTLKEWSKVSNLSYHTLYSRNLKGISGNELLLPPKERKNAPKKIAYLGEEKSLLEWSFDKRIQISWNTLKKRYDKGIRGDFLFEPPKKEKDVLIEYKGRKITFKELSNETGIKLITLYKRYERGKRGKNIYQMKIK